MINKTAKVTKEVTDKIQSTNINDFGGEVLKFSSRTKIHII